MKEIRTVQINSSAEMRLEGYAIVFDKPALIETATGSYKEIIRRTALADTDLADVALFYNHDINQIPLARTPDTMTLTLDDTGLKFSAILPNTSDGRAIYESVKRGDLRGCSFAFTVPKSGDVWLGNTRVISAIDKIYECSIVPYPAYAETKVEARSRKEVSAMRFENVAESFNHYRTKTVAEIEKRAAEIDNEIETAPTADIKALSIELEGMKQAKANIEESVGLLNNARATLHSVITGMDADIAVEGTAEDILESSEYRSAFFKTLQGKNLARGELRAMKLAKAQLERRANEFVSSTNSAAIIPTSTLDEIVKKARKTGGLLAEARAFSVPSKIAIPIGTPSSKASWHVEGSQVESEKVSPATVTFDGNEILKVFSISAKVQTMAISAFESYLTDELEACVMETIGDALINGTGSGQGTGILNMTFTSDNSVTPASTSITYDDVIETVSKLKRGYANGAKFAMNNRTLWTVFYKMTDSNSRPLFIADLKNETIGKILGFDVIVDDYLPDNTVIFGNFAQYLGYNLPSGIAIETSRESSFKSGLIDYRAMCICDCKPLIEEAFVKLAV